MSCPVLAHSSQKLTDRIPDLTDRIPDLSPSSALKRAEIQLKKEVKRQWGLNWQFFVTGIIVGAAVATGLFLGRKAAKAFGGEGGGGGGTRCYSSALQTSSVRDISEAVADFVSTAISGEELSRIRLYRIVAGR